MSIFSTNFITSEISDKLNAFDKIDWLTSRKELTGLFGRRIVLKALFFIDWEDLSMRVKSYSIPTTPHFVLKTDREVKYVIRGGNSFPTYNDVFQLLLPSTFQSSINVFIIRYALAAKFKWFDLFAWNIYGAAFDEIYLATEFGSLYVPIKALLKKVWTQLLNAIILTLRSITNFIQKSLMKP